jgi:hypothetical protein
MILVLLVSFIRQHEVEHDARNNVLLLLLMLLLGSKNKKNIYEEKEEIEKTERVTFQML